MYNFEGQVVIITGSGSKRGIGRGTALCFAEQGATVVIADINETGVRDSVAAIENAGGKAFGVSLDVTDQASVDQMVQTVLDRFGRIDVLVNNAGISQRVTVEDMTMEQIKKLFEINFFGLVRCTKAVLPTMKRQRYGRIVSLSSVAGKRGGGFFGGAHYSASKAAVLGFSKNLAREVAAWGITVNCVAPGLINTDIWATLPQDAAEQIISTVPMGRPGETREIGAAICFLASQEASYITGEDVDINGGSHMD
jgi:NAD(P)-dependent dehydrogenase (short-subunit alcohol dehydrogenase family)